MLEVSNRSGEPKMTRPHRAGAKKVGSIVTDLRRCTHITGANGHAIHHLAAVNLSMTVYDMTSQ